MWTRRQGLVAGGIAALGPVPVLLPRRSRPVHLSAQRVELHADPEHVFELLISFEEGPRIVGRSANQIVAEFPIRVGWYQTTTLERVTLDPSRREVKFEQLRGPFFSVQTATEVFDISEEPGGVAITLRGVLWLRLGLFGWLITQLVVRPRWDAIDAKFLARLRERVESMNA